MYCGAPGFANVRGAPETLREIGWCRSSSQYEFGCPGVDAVVSVTKSGLVRGVKLVYVGARDGGEHEHGK